MCNDKPSYEELVEEKNGWRRLHDKYLKKCEELEAENLGLKGSLQNAKERVTHLERTRYDAHQEVVTGVSATVAQLGREKVRLRKVLKSLEWLPSPYSSLLFCPSCHVNHTKPHKDTCLIDSTLKEVG